jgi:hypothetical protein
MSPWKEGRRIFKLLVLLIAFNKGTFLEELTGLAQMHREAEAELEGLDLFDEPMEGGEQDT